MKININIDTEKDDELDVLLKIAEYNSNKIKYYDLDENFKNVYDDLENIENVLLKEIKDWLLNYTTETNKLIKSIEDNKYFNDVFRIRLQKRDQELRKEKLNEILKEISLKNNK